MHQVERLTRLHGVEAGLAAGVGFREVEAGELRWNQAALDVDVDAAAAGRQGRGGGCVPAVARDALGVEDLVGELGVHARAADQQVELAADGERRVADLLRREPPRVEPPEEVVGRIDPGRVGVERRRHAVSVRVDDQPVQRLEPPFMSDQPAREPIEELGVGRGRAELAEVVRAADDAPAEVVLPHAVGDHAGRELIVGRRDPLGEDAPTPRGTRALRSARDLRGSVPEQLGESRFDFNPGRVWVAAQEHAGWFGLRDAARQRERVLGLSQRVDRGVEPLDLFAESGVASPLLWLLERGQLLLKEPVARVGLAGALIGPVHPGDG